MRTLFPHLDERALCTNPLLYMSECVTWNVDTENCKKSAYFQKCANKYIENMSQSSSEWKRQTEHKVKVTTEGKTRQHHSSTSGYCSSKVSGIYQPNWIEPMS